MRDRFAWYSVALAATLLGLTVVGFFTWSSWLRVVLLAAPFILVTRFVAPVFFGWREPDERSRR